MKNLVIVGSLLCTVFSGLSFAEGGSDRLIERANARSQALAAQNERIQNDKRNTAERAESIPVKSS
ncbi:hypothetical protein PS918_00774 [Pseudomonas fluorescens]|uniref:Secreted protein n=1 Tax=Pseudomonas fluorescens TaxID=294 RepID=A0A5E7R5F4_PSEFL|nr:hypothetical protein [Pseudomonas fluorescens]VVP68637.1 hypothetical protein PS918_00774 [Pseudomonas fluorescens]